MIPQGASISEVLIDVSAETSITYRLDHINNRIVGMTDGIEAVKQAVFKILQTERYSFFCYSSDYGIELQRLIGEAPSFVRSELERRIREAIMQDDRVSSVINFNFDMNDEAALVQFTVVTIFGSFGEEINQHV